ncbi:MAG: response regulator [Oleiphilaceae bacterium]|nr:response regulator [Oleiphilaceae bacterium]
MMTPDPITILVAEDDPDDRLLIADAFSESDLTCDLQYVHDGEQLMQYLHRQAPFDNDEACPMPGLILLDLNMPLKDGREALAEIKNNPDFRRIPTVIFTTSSEYADVFESYDNGGNSFVVKPATFTGLLEVVNSLRHYWLETSELPNRTDDDD